MSSNTQQNSQYTAQNILHVTPREHIRLRPGMYIGGTDKRALHHLAWAAMDHMIEEAIEGYCNYIHIQIDPANTIRLEHNGLGLAVSNYPNITDYMTKIIPRVSIAGHYYGVQGSLHGIGLGILNALTETCTVQIRRDNGLWQQKFEQGLQVTKLENIREMLSHETDGICLSFKPDFTVLDENNFDFEMIVNRCLDIAYLIPKLTIQVDDNRGSGQCELLYAENGLEDWVCNQSSNPIHDLISATQTLELVDNAGKPYKVGIDLAFQFTNDKILNERSFINTVTTPEGGSHIEALHHVLLKTIFPENHQQYSFEDINVGFVGIIHALHPDPQFEGRTRMKLLNPEVEEVVAEAVKTAFRLNPKGLAQIREYLGSAS